MTDIDIAEDIGIDSDLPDPIDPSVEENEDGSAIVTIDEDHVTGEPGEHFANIADDLDQPLLKQTATDLVALIAFDKESRKKRDAQYEEGLRRTGLGDDAPGGAQFTGASKVVHPMLTEASVDFSSRAIKELFPASGPVKDMILGKVTRDKVDKARRKTAHMNWQLTVQMREFRAELEQLLTQLPLGGGQYLKLGWDSQRRRPSAVFIPIDDIYLPFSATNFYTAERKTHKQDVTQQEYDRRVSTGMYRDISLPSPSQQPESSSAGSANDKIEGREQTSNNEDGQRVIYEVAVNLDLGEHDGKLCPYIISIDETSSKVLAVYRNWLESDDNYNELTWIVEWPFVPWRGAYPIGLTQMIGGLSAAATGALRALLDSALINNFPGLLKLKGGSSGGSNESVQPTEIKEIAGSNMTDDIRKTVMPVPYNPPSPVLFSLLGFLVDAGKGVVRTTFENLADGKNANMPVGTTLALIEQGGTVFSAIHGRLHAAMQRTLEVLHRINTMYLEEDELRDEAGELLAYKRDYAGAVDVVPVSDPNIFSETQRFAQMQAVAQRAAQNPLYDQRKVEIFILEQLKIPNWEELLAKVPEPKRMNAVNENVAAALGRPVMAFPEQNHLAHLQAHLDFTKHPMFGMFILIAPKFLPLMLDHIKEHIVLWYATSMYELMKEATDHDPSDLLDQDEEVASDFDRLVATAGQTLLQQAGKVFSGIPPVVGAAIKLLQQLAPKPLITDPAQASMAETERKTAADQMKAQADQQEVQRKAQADQRDAQVKEQELAQRERDRAAEAEVKNAELAAEQQNADANRQADMAQETIRQGSEDARTELEVGARVEMNTADNDTARELAAAEIISGERVAVSTGTGINPNPGS